MSKGIKLLNKEIINEFFNPVLDGSTLSCSNDYMTYNLDLDQFNSFCERPNDLELNNDCSNSNFTNNTDGVVPGFSLSATFINGKPLTPWSARFTNAGDYRGSSRNNAINNDNLIQIYSLINTKFKDGFKKYINGNNDLEKIIINNTKILNVEKKGIDIIFNITFDLNEYNNIFCKLQFNSHNHIFECPEISKLSVENKLKIQGQILKKVNEFLQVPSGYYTLLAEDFFVFTQFGQLHTLHKDDVVDVIYSDDSIIRIKKEGKIYIIKKPDYYYFNWLFIKNIN